MPLMHKLDAGTKKSPPMLGGPDDMLGAAGISSTNTDPFAPLNKSPISLLSPLGSTRAGMEARTTKHKDQPRFKS